MKVALNQNQATYRPDRQPERSDRGRALADQLSNVNEKAYRDGEPAPADGEHGEPVGSSSS